MLADGSICTTSRCRASNHRRLWRRRGHRLPLGILMAGTAASTRARPFVSALYARRASPLAAAVMIWLGIGVMSKIAIVFLGAVFPILVNTITGVRTVNADFVKVARSFGSNDWQMFLTVALPSSVPLLLRGCGWGSACAGRHRGRR